MNFFISIMHLFDYVASKKLSIWNEQTQLNEIRHLSKAGCNSSPTRSDCCIQSLSRETMMNENLQKGLKNWKEAKRAKKMIVLIPMLLK